MCKFYFLNLVSCPYGSPEEDFLYNEWDFRD